MAETHAHGAHAHAHAHAAPTGFIRKYIFSLDHKVIGIQYYLLALVAVWVGMFLSLLMRMHLMWPTKSFGWMETLWPTGAQGGVMTPELYLSLLTMHGTIMVFFVLTTAPQSGFGNYILPIQIGAADMAFPTLNMLSFWITFVAFVLMIAAFFAPGGAPLSGWTAYPPLSALTETGPGQQMGQNYWILSLAVFCIASLLGALNFITTVLDLRTKGLTLMRMPLSVWGWFVTAILGLLAFGVLLSAGVLLLMDRVAGTSFFIPGGLIVNDKIIDHTGGSPLLWQHLFWFFGHPEVYIAILPSMCIVSQCLSTFARKPIFGYRAMVYAVCAIGAIGFAVWGHHMFISGMSPYTSMVFSVLTMSIGVPSAIKTFNWIGTLWGAKIRFSTPMLYAVGFVSLFVTGGLSGIFLGQPSIDLYFHDTYFVVAHFHLIMGVASIFGIFVGTYYWFPKMFARRMNETLGKVHFWITFIGTNAIFGPMHYLGVAAHPRRYSELSGVKYLAALEPLQQFITIAAFVTIAGQFIFLFNFIWTLWKGERCTEENPWQSTTLEWTVPSPPPHDNFGGKEVVVNYGPYEYAVPGAPRDYVMQTDPPGVKVSSH